MDHRHPADQRVERGGGSMAALHRPDIGHAAPIARWSRPVRWSKRSPCGNARPGRRHRPLPVSATPAPRSAPPPRSPRRRNGPAGSSARPARVPPWRTALALVSSRASKSLRVGRGPVTPAQSRTTGSSPPPAPGRGPRQRRARPRLGAQDDSGSFVQARTAAGSTGRRGRASPWPARPPPARRRSSAILGDPLGPVAAQDLGAQAAPPPCDFGQRRDRRMARSAQRRHERPLDPHRSGSHVIVAASSGASRHRRRGIRSRSPPAPARAACLDRDRSDLRPQPVEPGGGKHRRIGLARAILSSRVSRSKPEPDGQQAGAARRVG